MPRSTPCHSSTRRVTASAKPTAFPRRCGREPCGCCNPGARCSRRWSASGSTTRTPQLAAFVDTLQRRLMNAKHHAAMVKPDGMRRDYLPIDMVVGPADRFYRERHTGVLRLDLDACRYRRHRAGQAHMRLPLCPRLLRHDPVDVSAVLSMPTTSPRIGSSGGAPCRSPIS